jgi:hypothetical protein
MPGLNTTMYAAQVEQYRKSGDICEFLNVTIQVAESEKKDELAIKFAALEEADLYLSSGYFMER